MARALEVLRGSRKTVLVLDNADALTEEDLFFYKLLDIVHFRDRASLLVFTVTDYFFVSKLSLRVQSRLVHNLIDVGWIGPWSPPGPAGPLGAPEAACPPRFLAALEAARCPGLAKFALQMIFDRLYLPEGEEALRDAAGAPEAGLDLAPENARGFRAVLASSLAFSPLLELVRGAAEPSPQAFVREWNASLLALASDAAFLDALGAFMIVENTPGAVLRVLGDAVEELVFGGSGAGEPWEGRDGPPALVSASGGAGGVSAAVSTAVSPAASAASAAPAASPHALLPRTLTRHLLAARNPLSLTPTAQAIDSLSTEALCLLCILVTASEVSATAFIGTSVDAAVDSYLSAHEQLKLSLWQRQLIKRSDFELFAAGFVYRRKGRVYVRLPRAALLEYRAAAGGMPGISEMFL